MGVLVEVMTLALLKSRCSHNELMAQLFAKFTFRSSTLVLVVFRTCSHFVIPHGLHFASTLTVNMCKKKPDDIRAKL